MGDREIRNLERSALRGDLLAGAMLEQAKRRAGLSKKPRNRLRDAVECAKWGCQPFDEYSLTRNGHVKWNAPLPPGWIEASHEDSRDAPIVANSFFRGSTGWIRRRFIPAKSLPIPETPTFALARPTARAIMGPTPARGNQPQTETEREDESEAKPSARGRAADQEPCH